MLVLWAMRTLVLRIVWRRSDDMKARYQWGKVSGYATVTIGALIMGRIWFAGFQSFATFAELIIAGIAIALKDLVTNIAGWIFILWRRPFVVGDRVQIGCEHAEHLSAKAAERVREASKKFMIFYSTLTPTVYTTVKDSGVLLTIRYLCRPRRRRSTEQAIWEDVLEQFAAVPGIDFAYSTTRFFDRGGGSRSWLRTKASEESDDAVEQN